MGGEKDYGIDTSHKEYTKWQLRGMGVGGGLLFICLRPQAQFLLLALLKKRKRPSFLFGRKDWVYVVSGVPPIMTNLPLCNTEHYLESFLAEEAVREGDGRPFVC